MRPFLLQFSVDMNKYLIGSVLTLSIVFTGCKQENTLFKKIDKEQSGLDFSNTIIINDSINILDNEFTYNGAGVAVGELL